MAKRTWKDAANVLFNLMVITYSSSAYEIRALHYGVPCFDSVVYLGNNDKSALNVSLDPSFAKWTGASNFECTFRVDGGSGHSVVAVIQKLKLRAFAEDCIDYVEFQTKNSRMSVPYIYPHKRNKKQFCGEKNIAEMVAYPGENLLHLAENVYIAEGKDLIVKVFLRGILLRPGESLDFHIVFTAAKRSDCKEKGDLDCGNQTCIWKGFYMDGLVNCPYKNCSDEEGCEASNIKYSSGTGTTVIICAVVSMLCVLGMFLFCLYICRRCKVLCWARQARSPAADATGSHTSPSHRGEAMQPSAPPLISVNDKDLPPSYDSLFPARNLLKRSAVGQRTGRNSRSCTLSSVSTETCHISESTSKVNYQRKIARGGQNVPETSNADSDVNRPNLGPIQEPERGQNASCSHEANRRPGQTRPWRRWRGGNRGQDRERNREEPREWIQTWRRSDNRRSDVYRGGGHGGHSAGRQYRGLGRGQGLSMAIGRGRGLGGAPGRPRPQNPGTGPKERERYRPPGTTGTNCSGHQRPTGPLESKRRKRRRRRKRKGVAARSPVRSGQTYSIPAFRPKWYHELLRVFCS